LGVQGKKGSTVYSLGSAKFLEQKGVLTKTVEKKIESLHRKGFTVLGLADEDEVLDLFGVRDPVKETSKEAML
jgi:cation transport ATPase